MPASIWGATPLPPATVPLIRPMTVKARFTINGEPLAIYEKDGQSYLASEATGSRIKLASEASFLGMARRLSASF